MTISIPTQTFYELCQKTIEPSQQLEPDDAFDEMFKFPQLLGEGYWRYIELQEGLELEIANYQLHDDLTIEGSAGKHSTIDCIFFLLGRSQWISPLVGAEQQISCGRYSFWGSGFGPEYTIVEPTAEPMLWVNIAMESKLVRSVIGNPFGELPPQLQRLIRPDQLRYGGFGTTSFTMQNVLQQILYCPYQGVTKRLYLQSKVWELLVLLIESTVKEQQEPQRLWKLKSEDIERIYYAKEILLQRLDNPPSLMELARQVGLSESHLKRGFRQVLGTTAFGYLRNHRMEQARQLLEMKIYKVEEIAQIVGYQDPNAFSRAFHKHFGIRARDCMKRRSLKIWV